MWKFCYCVDGRFVFVCFFVCEFSRSSNTGDPLHSRAACTQPCNVNTHSRAHCSPGARLCEQWEHGCVNNGARLCASARLCRGSPVSKRIINKLDHSEALVTVQAIWTITGLTLYIAGHLHTAVLHCSHSRAPIVHTAVPRENIEHGCVYLRCRAVCKLPGCVEGHPWIKKLTKLGRQIIN